MSAGYLFLMYKLLFTFSFPTKIKAYVSHMKLMSKIAVGLPTGLNLHLLNFPMMSYFWRILRMCASKPEVVVCSAILIALVFYLQALDLWSRTLLGKIQFTLGRTTSKVPLTANITVTLSSWVRKTCCHPLFSHLVLSAWQSIVICLVHKIFADLS